jgi:MFS superfamily sulfate permease-like transporter
VRLGLDSTEVVRLVTLPEHESAKECAPGIVVVRPVATLFFGNAQSLRQDFRGLVASANGSLRHVVVDACALR